MSDQWGLTDSQRRILVAIARAGRPMSAETIVAESGCSATLVGTHLADGLAEYLDGECVTGYEGRVGRPPKRWTLSPAGEALVGEIADHWQVVADEAGTHTKADIIDAWRAVNDVLDADGEKAVSIRDVARVYDTAVEALDRNYGDTTSIALGQRGPGGRNRTAGACLEHEISLNGISITGRAGGAKARKWTVTDR